MEKIDLILSIFNGYNEKILYIYNHDSDVTIEINIGSPQDSNKHETIESICESLIYSSKIIFVNPDYIDMFIENIINIEWCNDEKSYVLNLLKEIYSFK